MTSLPEIANPTRKPYLSDLSDAEWEVMPTLIPKPKGFGQLEVVWVDQGYSGKNFANAVKQVCGEEVRVEVSEANVTDFRATAKAMDCGAYLWLVKSIPTVEQGL